MTIKEMRERKRELGYSYEKLSKMSGVPLGTVQKVLGGVTKSPRYETLQALEHILSGAWVQSADRLRESSVPVWEQYLPRPTDEGRVQGEYTAEDYYAIPEGIRIELIDGVLYDMELPHTVHQLMCMEIGGCLRDYVRKNRGSCVVFSSPPNVHLDRDDRTVVGPDVMVICDREKFQKGRIYGAPDLIIEILSPSTEKKDKELKLRKYAAAGVREYWLVDWRRKRIAVYDFARGGELALYGIREQVPVGIWNGECRVDFAEIDDYVKPYMDS